MPLKRFCAGCDIVIPDDTLFFEVLVQPKRQIEARDVGSNYYNEYCQSCADSGQALVDLMNERKQDTEEKEEWARS